MHARRRWYLIGSIRARGHKNRKKIENASSTTIILLAKKLHSTTHSKQQQYSYCRQYSQAKPARRVQINQTAPILKGNEANTRQYIGGKMDSRRRQLAIEIIYNTKAPPAYPRPPASINHTLNTDLQSSAMSKCEKKNRIEVVVIQVVKGRY